MVLPNGNEYKTVLLDTNVLQNLSTCPKFADRLLSRFCLQQPISIFCFSFYNVIELSNKRRVDDGKIDIYSEFVGFFSRIPCLMFFPYKCLLQAELSSAKHNSSVTINGEIAYAFTPCLVKAGYYFNEWLSSAFSFNHGSVLKLVQDDIRLMPTVASDWMKMRSPKPITACDFDTIRRSQERNVVLSFLDSCGIDSTGLDYMRFPAARTMLFSQMQRVHYTNRTLKQNDVMDVCISAFAPYVDTVVTEAFQADVYRKTKNSVPQLENVEILSIRDV